MIKRFALTLCLLTSTLWIAGSIPAVFAQEITPTVIQAPTATNLTLTLQDLPPGFRELPKNMEDKIKPRLEAFTQQLAQTGMKPGKYFIFINPQTFQIVFGFTGMLSTQPEQANFDATLKQMQEPEVQQEIINQYREVLKQAQGIEIVDYSAIPDLNNIAEASTGMSVAVAMQGRPLRLDITAFRRSNVGAFAAIIHPGAQVQSLQLSTIARKLDGRILETAGVPIPVVAPNSEVTPSQPAESVINSTPSNDTGIDATGGSDSPSNSSGTTEN